MPNLRDFFIGVIDFFAVLLPGAVVAYAAWRTGVPTHVFGVNPTGTAAWIALSLAAYLCGHLLFMFGSVLDPLYDWRRRLKMPVSRDGTFAAASSVRKKLNPELAESNLSTFKWAKAYVALHAPEGRAEIDAIEATSKLFRSLVVLFAAAAIIWVVRPLGADAAERVGAPLGAVVLSWLCFLRYYDQRWKLTELAYTYAVLVHTRARTPAAAPAD